MCDDFHESTKFALRWCRKSGREWAVAKRSEVFGGGEVVNRRHSWRFASCVAHYRRRLACFHVLFPLFSFKFLTLLFLLLLLLLSAFLLLLFAVCCWQANFQVQEPVVCVAASSTASRCSFQWPAVASSQLPSTNNKRLPSKTALELHTRALLTCSLLAAYLFFQHFVATALLCWLHFSCLLFCRLRSMLFLSATLLVYIVCVLLLLLLCFASCSLWRWLHFATFFGTSFRWLFTAGDVACIRLGEIFFLSVFCFLFSLLFYLYIAFHVYWTFTNSCVCCIFHYCTFFQFHIFYFVCIVGIVGIVVALPHIYYRIAQHLRAT